MTRSLDPEVLAGINRYVELGGPPVPLGDVDTRRAGDFELFTLLAASRDVAAGVQRSDYSITSYDGAEVGVAWFRSASPNGAAVVYLHGGGMFVPMLPGYDEMMREYAVATGVSMLLVDYRVAPENPHPAPVEDSYAALTWLAERSDELGIDPARIAVMGDSAGGGLAAGVALMARDRGGPAIAQQLLFYPMLDDSTVTPDPAFPPECLVWNYVDNRTAWDAYLSATESTSEVSPYAAPSRAVDLSGLPSSYIDVGDLDIFRDENAEYARRLMKAGVPVELHVLPGCPHAFELFAPEAEVSRGVFEARLRRLRSL